MTVDNNGTSGDREIEFPCGVMTDNGIDAEFDFPRVIAGDSELLRAVDENSRLGNNSGMEVDGACMDSVRGIRTISCEDK